MYIIIGVRGISKRSAAPNGISSGLTPTDVCVCAWGGWGSVHGGGWTPPHPAVVRRRGGRPGPKIAGLSSVGPRGAKSAKKCTSSPKWARRAPGLQNLNTYALF